MTQPTQSTIVICYSEKGSVPSTSKSTFGYHPMLTYLVRQEERGDGKTQDSTMQVVDGQQRLTSLYAVVKGLQVWREDYSRDRIRIAFNPLTERFEVTTPVFEKSAEWIPDIVAVFSDSITTRSIEPRQADGHPDPRRRVRLRSAGSGRHRGPPT